MQTLNQEAYDRARNYMKTEVRPLERVLFEYYVEDAPAEPALQELARFQNPDGGFGNGLEPDAQTPASSALHTAVGLRTLKELGAGADDPMVQRAVRYLLDTYDEDSKVWRIMPPAVNDAPHAPWWQDEGDSLAEGFGGFRLNPRAELVGLLHHYSELVPADMLDAVTADTIAAFEAGDDEDFHSLVNVISLAETDALAAEYRQRLAPRIKEQARSTVTNTPEEWREYGPQPITFAPLPTSLLAEELSQGMQTNLDYVIEQQAEDGSWGPNWEWGDYPEAWQEARRNWSGVLTLNNLRSLRAFGRIEGLA